MERVERKFVLSGAASVMIAAGPGLKLADGTAAVVACDMLYTLSSNVMSNA